MTDSYCSKAMCFKHARYGELCPEHHIKELEAEVERLQKEVTDHAEWAQRMMDDPSSEAYKRLMNEKIDAEAALERVKALPRFNVELPYPSGGNLRVIANKDGQWVRAAELNAALEKDDA